MAGRVRIDRDDWGVPHVAADSEPDVFFGVGYAQAQDQLPRIYEHYLAVHGRMASVKGADAIEMDRLSLRWRTLIEARAGFERLSPELQDNYHAFMAGIQRYADEHPDQVPDWAPELEPALPIGYLRLALWGYAIREAVAKLQRAGVGLPVAAPERSEALKQRLSNEWLLMPWRTAADALILLSDPHGDIDGLRMFEVGMDTGTFRSIGAAVVGCALPILGHTEHVAWGLTTGNPDVSDAYQVACDPDDPRRYQIDGQWRTMVTEAVTIEVANGDAIDEVYEYTQHNDVLCLVVARDGDRAYVISTPYMHVPEVYDEQLYRQHLAGDVFEYRDALRTNANFSQNVLAGDRHGNAIYVRAGRTPIRPAGVDHTQVLDGSTSKTAWEGIHPLEDLVQIENPEAGYLQNCNIAPDTMLASTEGTTLQADRYRPYLFNDQPGRVNTRGRRVTDLLSRSTQATVEDALEIALDEKWIDVERWQVALRDAAGRDPDRVRIASPSLRRLLHLIGRFDGFAAAASTGATAYWHWRTALGWSELLPVGELKDLIDRVNGGRGLDDDQAGVLLDALDRASDALLARTGRVDVPLGELFRIGRGGRSYPGRAPAIFERPPTEDETELGQMPMLAPLRLMAYGPPDEHGQRFPLLGGRSLRMVAFTQPITSYSVILFGQSGREDSPHFADQCRLFSERRVRSTYFDPAELRAHTVATIELETGT
ncbi:MAG TPA: penicillin acylase family protein [Nitriliruptorales bacterium]